MGEAGLAVGGVPENVRVNIADGGGVAEGVGVRVGVRERLCVSASARLSVAVGVGDRVGLRGEADRVSEGVAEPPGDAVRVAVEVPAREADGDLVAVPVCQRLGDGLGVLEHVGVAVAVGLCVPVGEGVRLPVPTGLPVREEGDSDPDGDAATLPLVVGLERVAHEGVGDDDGEGVSDAVSVRVDTRDAVLAEGEGEGREPVPETLKERVDDPEEVAVSLGVRVNDGDGVALGVCEWERDVAVGEREGEGGGLREDVGVAGEPVRVAVSVGLLVAL